MNDDTDYLALTIQIGILALALAFGYMAFNNTNKSYYYKVTSDDGVNYSAEICLEKFLLPDRCNSRDGFKTAEEAAKFIAEDKRKRELPRTNVEGD